MFIERFLQTFKSSTNLIHDLAILHLQQQGAQKAQADLFKEQGITKNELELQGGINIIQLVRQQNQKLEGSILQEAEKIRNEEMKKSRRNTTTTK